MDPQAADATRLATWLTPERIENAVRVFVMLFAVLPAVWIVAKIAARLTQRRAGPHYALMARRAITYTGTTIVVVTILSDLGFKLGPVLSAAGIAGVAIGFAAQTTLSNFISGIFLVTEKSFSMGDVIEAGGVTGVVLSIDLMSVKLRTFDNRFVRIPSSQLIQNTVVNVTRFPIRRVDFSIGVAYRSDLGHVRRVLLEIAEKHTLCLDDPAPLVIFQNFGESALELLFGVWCAREDFVTVRNEIAGEIKKRFDAESIEIPFPHRVLAGAAEPLAVRVVPEKK